MMTVDMDRTALAPRPVPVRPTPPSGGGARRPDARPGARRPAAPPARPTSSLPLRRIAAGVFVGALTMFGVAALDTFAGATVPVLGSFAALPSGGDEVPRTVVIPPPSSQPGTCLNWSRADAADAAVVDCAQPHLFEQMGSVALTDQPSLPGDQQWRQLVSQRCDPLVTKYLGGKFDPDGRFRVGALKPSSAKWAEGDRELRCGLQSASQSGALYPMTGKVADSDQSDVEQPGTCLGINGKQIGDPVSCTGVHAVETVGIVDLSKKFTGGFPAVADQDAFLQPTCAKIAADYAGGDKVIADKKLTVYWDNMTQESWTAGSRQVNCNLGALLPDKSGFAPVTGSVKGAVAVGDQPAPVDTTTPAPGAPAPAPVDPATDQPTAGPAPTVAPTTAAPAPSAANPPPVVDLPALPAVGDPPAVTLPAP